MPAPAVEASRAADRTAVPIAVHPFDLDSVFLSKTVVSLPDVFTHAVNDAFDLAPLPLRDTATATAASSSEAVAATDAEAPLPFSGGTRPFVTSSPRDAAPDTSAKAARDYARVMRDTVAPPLHTAEPLQVPALRVVPLDAYHFLLSFRDVDVAHSDTKSCSDVANFASATQRATTAIAMVSAGAPGCRPPRSGLCVVRRVEGEMRDAATLDAQGGHIFPTASRVAQHLPLKSFDGWVRDYTVYGLSRNAGVLREAWADKVRERATSEEEVNEGRSDDKSDGVTEVGEAPAQLVSAVTGVSAAHTSPAPPIVPSSLPPSELTPSHVVAAADAPRSPSASQAGANVAGDDGGHASDRGDGGVEAKPAAATISPSLERLHCSSTTAASSSSSRESDTPPAHPEANAQPPPQQQQQQLWKEERRREAVAAARLGHRFLVSDGVHHALWALEVTIPAMAVRVVAPAEFYTLDEGHVDGVESLGRHTQDIGEDSRTAAAAASTRLPQKKPATEVTASQTCHCTPTKDTAAATAAAADTDQAVRPRSPSPVERQSILQVEAGEEEKRVRPASVATHASHDASPSPLRTQDNNSNNRSRSNARTSRGRSSRSASPSVVLAEAVPMPLMGGARGFVDGHFSVARFNSPGALCWRVDEVASEEDEGREANASASHSTDPVSSLQRQRRCSVLFISDVGNYAIRYANFHNRLVRTIAGMDGVPGYRDGSCVSSLLRGATALAWCSAGLLFTDGPNSVVRLVTHVSKPLSPLMQQQKQQRAKTDSVPLPEEVAACGERRDVPEALFSDPPASPPAGQEVAAAGGDPSETRASTGDGPTASLRSTAHVVPRVWTLAGCVDIHHHNTAAGEAASATSYVDSSVPSRARFGFLSDMALRADETGNTQLFLLDQTHHAVRILDGEGGGVSTYVGPLDYAAAASGEAKESDALPPGLIHPSSLAMCALIKERSPALLGSTSANAADAAAAPAVMLTPQPYLYSATPMLFVASGATGVVSVLLPVSQRSGLAPWNAAASTSTPTAATATQDAWQGIQAALTLGLATEGRRTIGEATVPSLKHVVPGWGIKAMSDDEENGGGDDTAAAAAEESAAVRRLLRTASRQEALVFLRLRFPWVLPPAVPVLHPRLVAGCCCHVSGRRRAASTQQQQQPSHRRDRSVSGGGVAVSLLPRSSHSLSGGPPTSPRAAPLASSSPRSSPIRHPVQPQRLLFSTPPRHPVVTPTAVIAGKSGASSYAAAMADPRTVAAAKEVAELLRVQPRVVEATAQPQAEQPPPGSRLTCSSSSSSSITSHHSVPPSQECAGPAPHEDTAVVGEGVGEEEAQQQQQTRARAADAALKWLPPPTKSLSRSPMSTPRKNGGHTSSTTNSATEAAAAALPTTELPTTPPRPSTAATSYAAKFQRLPAEQRQLRLLQTLDEKEENEGRDEEGEGEDHHAAPTAATAAETSSPLPEKPPRCALPPTASASPTRPSRGGHPALSRSPSSGGRVSPPLTPRAIATHQLMQRRRTSRSNTAAPPHVASVGRTAGGGSTTGKEDAAQDPEIVTRATTTTAAAVAAAGAVGGERVSSMHPRQHDDSLSEDRCRSPSHTVHEAGEAPQSLFPNAPGTVATMGPLTRTENRVRRALPPPLLSYLHDAYDAAVRSLFRVYAYFATRTVTHTSSLPTAAAAAAGGRRLSRPVEHYSMTFCAFHRFLILTGYLDCISSIARQDANGGAGEAVKGGTGGEWRWSAYLTHVQRRGPTAAAAASSSSGKRRLSFVHGGTSLAARRPSTSSSTTKSTPTALSLLPLSTSDSRAVADVLYSCGVRMQGYHVVTCMDFQSFRRAVLLLRTWALTACEKQRRGDGRSEKEEEEKGGAAVFAYLDYVPSLDALSAEQVVEAYTEVYAQAARTVPALHGPQPTPSAEDNDAAPTPHDTAAGAEIGHRSSPSRRQQSDQSSPANSCYSNFQRDDALEASPDDDHDVGTPSVSPIPFAKGDGGDDEDALSCLSDAAGAHSGGEMAIDAARSPPPPPPYTLPGAAAAAGAVLSAEERRALDSLLRLLQSNEATLRQLFDAYSVPVTVHRSASYEAPHAAAAAAAVSNPCSLLLDNRRSLNGRNVSRDGSRALTTPAQGRAKMWDFAASSQTGTRPRISGRPSATTSAGAVVLHTEGTLQHVLHCLPSTAQDVWWKVQQLYTMSSLESKDVAERMSRSVHVMPYKHFVELWRTLDVFPALMNATATQQAYLDAVTTTLMRGSGSAAGAGPAPETAAAAAAGLPAKEVQDVLYSHTGLPFPCFLESVVRVAMTVFSHDVDRVAYPTSAAKTTGLMQWCNKQVMLGLVEQRTQRQLRTGAAGVLRSEVNGGGGEGGSGRRGSYAASPLLTTRGSRSTAVKFPDHLRLFRVPAAHRQA